MKRTVIAFLGFAATHFAVSYGGAVLLLFTVGLSRPDIVGVFESVLVAGVTFGGLPDTAIGWLLNSLLYGFIFAVVFYVWQRRVRGIAHESA
jgi:hypothetical protein